MVAQVDDKEQEETGREVTGAAGRGKEQAVVYWG